MHLFQVDLTKSLQRRQQQGAVDASDVGRQTFRTRTMSKEKDKEKDEEKEDEDDKDKNKEKDNDKEGTVWTSFSRGTRICKNLRSLFLQLVMINQDYGKGAFGPKNC